MVTERLLARVLLVQQEFIWIVVRSVDDELKIARLLADRRRQFAQNCLDLFRLTGAGTPVCNHHIGHGAVSRTLGAPGPHTSRLALDLFRPRKTMLPVFMAPSIHGPPYFLKRRSLLI